MKTEVDAGNSGACLAIYCELPMRAHLTDYRGGHWRLVPGRRWLPWFAMMKPRKIKLKPEWQATSGFTVLVGKADPMDHD